MCGKKLKNMLRHLIILKTDVFPGLVETKTELKGKQIYDFAFFKSIILLVNF